MGSPVCTVGECVYRTCATKCMNTKNMLAFGILLENVFIICVGFRCQSDFCTHYLCVFLRACVHVCRAMDVEDIIRCIKEGDEDGIRVQLLHFNREVLMLSSIIASYQLRTVGLYLPHRLYS